MKKILSVVVVAFQFSIFQAQELPEIPMKNGKVYYSFKHKLDNSKKCISKYYSNDFIIKLGQRLQAYSLKLTGDKSNKEEGVYMITLSGAPSPKINYGGISLACKDTSVSKYNFIKFPINNKSKKPSKEISFTVETIFFDKNNYILNFKGFLLKEQYVKKGTITIDEINLEDRYNEVLSNSEKSDIDIDFFNKLNEILNEIDNIYKNVFELEYSTDEE
jgi:hypothetical protein